MHRFTIAPFLALAALLAAVMGPHHLFAERQGTAADKVYNEDQARRGLAVYDQKCSSCHDGGSMGPELWGSAFLSQWRSKDVESLYKVIAETMPQDTPGSLNEAETLKTIAYILKQNGYSPGDNPLQSRKQLAGMKFTAPQ